LRSAQKTLAEPKSKRVKTEPGARDHAQSVDAAPDAPPPEILTIGKQREGNHRADPSHPFCGRSPAIRHGQIGVGAWPRFLAISSLRRLG